VALERKPARELTCAEVDADTQSRLVLIHPIANERRSWQLLELDSFEHPPVAFYEMPGHGKKPRQPDMTLPWMADQLVEEFEGRLHLLGIAVGAYVALNALVRHPDRIASAILVNGGPGGVTEPAARLALIQRGQAAVEHGMESIVEETFGRWFTPYAQRTNPPGVQLARNILFEMDPAAWADIWRANAVSEAVPAEAIAAIEQPVSIVAAVGDAAATVAACERLHALVVNSRLQYTPGPHMLHLERPRSLTSAMDHHFTWLQLGGCRVDQPLYFAGE
jgi:pimeloyl-ACP methyl ester carboxylesterase